MYGVEKGKKNKGGKMVKFKAGDSARFKYQPNVRVFILEVLEQTCYAGVAQTWYTVRQYKSEKIEGGVGRDFFKVSAIELEPIPKPYFTTINKC
uniref:Uncharacterized protein n=1 Tax=viral metagenome TaxID=1070528 RepID=A0A6M3IQY5_9ZZZZ